MHNVFGIIYHFCGTHYDAQGHSNEKQFIFGKSYLHQDVQKPFNVIFE